jgi:GxxExxY protein
MNNKVVYPKLSYKIMGCLFEVFKELGFGHREKYYQSAVAEEFTKQNISFQKEVSIPLNYKSKNVGKVVFDFLIANKIILELKTGNYFRKRNLDQIISYLRANKIQLGIIANFTRNGVKFKRVLNIK